MFGAFRERKKPLCSSVLTLKRSGKAQKGPQENIFFCVFFGRGEPFLTSLRSLGSRGIIWIIWNGPDHCHLHGRTDVSPHRPAFATPASLPLLLSHPWTVCPVRPVQEAWGHEVVSAHAGSWAVPGRSPLARALAHRTDPPWRRWQMLEWEVVEEPSGAWSRCRAGAHPHSPSTTMLCRTAGPGHSRSGKPLQDPGNPTRRGQSQLGGWAT